MAFAPIEESRQKALPVTLYQFIYDPSPLSVPAGEPGYDFAAKGWLKCCEYSPIPPTDAPEHGMRREKLGPIADCSFVGAPDCQGMGPVTSSLSNEAFGAAMDSDDTFVSEFYRPDTTWFFGGLRTRVWVKPSGAGIPVFSAGGTAPAPPAGYFAITDAEQDIVDAGIIYKATPVMRDAVVSSGTLDRTTITIRMPRDIEFAEKFRVYPPTVPVTLIIKQGHLSDTPAPEFLVVWSGRVLSVGREGDECVVSCEPVSSSLRRPGLRRNYQLGCPHVLYGNECKADRVAATHTSTVVSKSGTSITVASGWNGVWNPIHFREGVVEWTNDDGGLEKRKILAVSGNTLALGGLLRDLDAGDSVSIILGCNHQMSDCFNVFDNILNHGGCPWIPDNNPIGFRNRYY